MESTANRDGILSHANLGLQFLSRMLHLFQLLPRARLKLAHRLDLETISVTGCEDQRAHRARGAVAG